MQSNAANRLGNIERNLPCDADRWLAFVPRGDVARLGVGQRNCNARSEEEPCLMSS